MKKILLILLSMPMLLGCATWRSELRKSPGIESCIYNAITDFQNRSKLYKNNLVFEISIKTDSIKGTAAIAISPNEEPIYSTPYEVAGTKPHHMILVDYIELDGRLYLLYNGKRNKIITQDYIDVLKKYNLLDTSWYGVYPFPPGMDNDGYVMDGYLFYLDTPLRYKRMTKLSYFTGRERAFYRKWRKMKAK